MRFFCLLLLFSSAAFAENGGNFSAGLGKSLLYNDPYESYSRTEENWHHGLTLNIGYQHSDYFFSRAYLYSLSGKNDVKGWGTELQLLAALGMSTPGLRLYSGPALFRERRNDQDAIHNDQQTFSGPGWVIGGGYQWQRWTLDVSTTVRDNRDYVRYYEDNNIFLHKSKVWALSFFTTVSYQL